MKIIKRAGIALLAIFVMIQFIRPPKNASAESPVHDIGTTYSIPPEIATILRTSCYNCHSNNTVYPWYAHIQPAGWFLNGHIQDGKHELNFSDFALYSARRQYIKLGQIAKEIEEEEMPLPSYLLIHWDAKLSDEQRQDLIAWTEALRETIRSIYPPDSLVRRR